MDRGRGDNQGDRAGHEHNQGTECLGSLLDISLQDNTVGREWVDTLRGMAILDSTRDK